MFLIPCLTVYSIWMWLIRWQNIWNLHLESYDTYVLEIELNSEIEKSKNRYHTVIKAAFSLMFFILDAARTFWVCRKIMKHNLYIPACFKFAILQLKKSWTGKWNKHSWTSQMTITMPAKAKDYKKWTLAPVADQI